ncbi:MAG: glycosyltransferase family 9 protein [Veillonellaceae bacterium]|nr:glycosyltransferase family 9 protein [Veillonellaceae bacterium]
MAVTKDYERILIIKMSSLGDIIAALPTLYALRQRFPQAHISWVVQQEFAAVLPGKPYIDELIFIDRKRLRQPSYWCELRRELRRHSFDLVLDLQMIAKSALVAFLSGCPTRYGYWEAREGSGLVSKAISGPQRNGHISARLLDVAAYLGAPTEEIRYPLPDFSAERETIRGELRELGITGDFVVLAPGSRGAVKNWPPEHWAELATRITADGTAVVIAGAAGDRDLAERIMAKAENPRVYDFTGRTSLRGLMALESLATMHISADTGPLHIANAVRTSLIGLFGPTRPERSGPFGNLRGDSIAVSSGANGARQKKRDDTIRMTDIAVADVYALYCAKRKCEN